MHQTQHQSSVLSALCEETSPVVDSPDSNAKNDKMSQLSYPFVRLLVRPAVTLLRFPRICKYTVYRVELKYGWWNHDGTPSGYTWLIFGRALLTRRFLASDWSSSFRTFADKPR